ncbi:Protein of unknown function; Putative transposase (fragment) [Bradyrhizobium sp. ORS 285]
MEVIPSKLRRSHWSRAANERVVAVVLQPGATILGVALSGGASSHLFGWCQRPCGRRRRRSASPR